MGRTQMGDADGEPQPLPQSKRLALRSATETGVYLYEEGLVSLGEMPPDADAVFLPLLLLAQGAERFMKVALILDEYERLGVVPVSLARKRGHALSAMAVEIRELAVREGIPAERLRDISAVQVDSVGEELMEMMNDFAGKGRYFDLDGLSDEETEGRSDPREVLSSVRLSMARHPSRMTSVLVARDSAKFRSEEASLRNITGDFIESLQRFGRGLASLFVGGHLGPEGERLTPVVQGLLIPDKDLRSPPSRYRRYVRQGLNEE